MAISLLAPVGEPAVVICNVRVRFYLDRPIHMSASLNSLPEELILATIELGDIGPLEGLYLRWVSSMSLAVGLAANCNFSHVSGSIGSQALHLSGWS